MRSVTERRPENMCLPYVCNLKVDCDTVLHCTHAEFEGVGEGEERAGQECFDGHLNGPL